MGGFGTWALIEAYPKTLAAAIPLCGRDPKQAEKLIKLPIWAFHGAKDESVSIEGSRTIINALRKAGGNPRHTEYPDTGHDAWTKAFVDLALFFWVFSQSRGG